MTPTIAFVGAGPTTLYTLSALLRDLETPARVTIFESQPTAGLGSPYRAGWNDPAMLANIASIEIPPVTETLVAWLHRQTSEKLETWRVAPAEIDERAFYPRVLLGRYFADQFGTLVAMAARSGVAIDVRTRCRVVDVANEAASMSLTTIPEGGAAERLSFDHVVLATGHQWPSKAEVRPGYFLTPWPASDLAAIPPVQVGIRGSSLTAIDAVVALARAHGDFLDTANAQRTYAPRPGTEGFGLTMMSRKGLLPEADFYFPLPFDPLVFCTPEAIAQLVAEASGDLLDEVFDLFRQELMLCDPAYSEAMGLIEADLETFCERYFAARAAADPFDWAEANLREARANLETKTTAPWRYAILRMHEVVGAVAPHLDGPQFERFNRCLKPVFVDDYGAVPHESIERLLALHRAGKLQVLALGEDYRIDSHRPEGGAVLQRGADRRHFPIFIEATGQKPMSGLQFPFLSLLEQGIVTDEVSSDAPHVVRGIAIDDKFHPVSAKLPAGRLFCLGLPFLMGRHPFIQGITSSYDMGEIVGRELAEIVAASIRNSSHAEHAEAA